MSRALSREPLTVLRVTTSRDGAGGVSQREPARARVRQTANPRRGCLAHAVRYVGPTGSTAMRRYGVLPSVFLVAAALAAVTCASAPPPTRTTVMSFQDLDCSSCGEDVARAIIEAPGVRKTAFDRRTAELEVVAAPGIDALALARSKRSADDTWTLVAGSGLGRYLAHRAPPADADVVEIESNGRDVPDLASHLAPGKVNVVDFFATWCGPCRDLDDHVLDVLRTRTGIAYRKLDVGDWDTPIVAHYLTPKGVGELPYVIVFDRAGKEVAAIAGLDLARLDRALDEASR
jgi:thiol-disulfide isomerase/thioredoxin